MKKQIVILSVAVLLAAPLFAAEEQRDPGQAVVTEAPAPKSPWSASLSVEAERSADTAEPLVKGASATTKVKVGRKLLDGVSLSLTWPFANKLEADTSKTGVQQYVAVKDPSVALGLSRDIYAGVKGKAGLSATLPVIDTLLVDALQRAKEKNPHKGHYGYNLSLERAFGALTLSATQSLTRFNFDSATNAKGKLNNRHSFSYGGSLGYQLTKAISLSTSVTSSIEEKKRTGEREYSLAWGNSVGVEPISGLSLEASVALTAPNQAIGKFFRDRTDKSTVLQNTNIGLSASYSFL